MSYNAWKYGNCRGKIERIRSTVKELFNFIIVKNNYIILGANDIIECEAV